jgi:radical SAM superfamily enzyme YgiQ (UPF0313 family)
MGSVNLITARGCPYKCNWCSHAVFGYTHRRRSPADCAAEVQYIKERYQPEQVWYADDVFTISHKWLFDYAGELKARGLKLPFETISRADRMRKDEVMATLGERQPAHPRRDATGRDGGRGAAGHQVGPGPRYRGGHVFDVGV